MTTIQKRAKEFANTLPYSERTQYFAEQGYIRGANEQKKIDIDKACDLLISALNEGFLETNDIGKLNMWMRDQLGKEMDFPTKEQNSINK